MVMLTIPEYNAYICNQQGQEAHLHRLNEHNLFRRDQA